MATGTKKPLEAIGDYLDPEHEALQPLGITADTYKAFKAGYKPKGLFAGRLALPIFKEGLLVAYVGRAVKKGQEPQLVYPRDFDPSVNVFGNVTKDTAMVTADPLKVLAAHQVGLHAVSILEPSTKSLRYIADILGDREIEIF